MDEIQTDPLLGGNKSQVLWAWMLYWSEYWRQILTKKPNARTAFSARSALRAAVAFAGEAFIQMRHRNWAQISPMDNIWSGEIKREEI